MDANVEYDPRSSARKDPAEITKFLARLGIT